VLEFDAEALAKRHQPLLFVAYDVFGRPIPQLAARDSTSLTLDDAVAQDEEARREDGVAIII
jgi:hypothetical protein